MPNHDYCAAFNCGHRRDRCPELSFFRFPKEKERCRRWVINTRREDLLRKTAPYLNTNCVLCADHFETSQFMNADQRNRLVWNAIPTLFSVPNPPALLSPKRKAPIARVAPPLQKKAKQVVAVPSIGGRANIPVTLKKLPLKTTPQAVFLAVGPETIPAAKLETSPGMKINVVSIPCPRFIIEETEDIPMINVKSPSGTKISDAVSTPGIVEAEKASSPNPEAEAEEEENVDPKEALSMHHLSDATERQRCACSINSSLSAKLSQHQKLAKQKIALIYRLKKKVAALKLERQPEEPTVETIVGASEKYLSTTAHAIFASQLHIGANKKMNWSVEMKTFALSMYDSSPKAYRTLSSVIHLPSIRTVQGFKRNFDFQPDTIEQVQDSDLHCEIVDNSCDDLLITCISNSPATEQPNIA